MAKHRAAEGRPLRISASDYNAAVDAGQWFCEQQQLGQGGAPSVAGVNPCVVRVRNDSGGDLATGAVVEITSSTVTMSRKNLWFSAIARTGNDPFCGVLLQPIKSGKYGDCQVSGVCMADVDIVDTDNTHARVVPGQTLLKGDFGGWARIVYKPGGTGTLRCAVLVGARDSVTRKIKTTSTITAAGSGTADFYLNGSDRDELTVYHNWADDSSIPDETETYARYFHDEDKWVVTPPSAGGASSPSTPLYLTGETRYKTGSSTWPRGGSYAGTEYWTIGYTSLFGSESDNHADIKSVTGTGSHFWEVDQSGWYRLSVYDTFSGAYTGTTTATATTSTNSGHNHTVSVYNGTGRMWQVVGDLWYKTSAGGAYNSIAGSAVIGYAMNEVGSSFAPNTPRGSISRVLFINATAGWLIQRRFWCHQNSLNEHEISWEGGSLQIEYMGANQTEFSPT